MNSTEKTGLSVLSFENYPVTPWKNGQGVTRNIFMAGPDGVNFDWRLSLAEVSRSGEFSEFSGYERTIVLLDGDGFSLDFQDDYKKDLNQIHKPFVFDGGASVNCKLHGGLSRDLNLITRRNHVKAGWRIRDIQPRLGLDLDGNFIHLFFCLSGNLRIKENNDASQDLSKWGCAKIHNISDSTVQITSGYPAKIIHIEISYL